HQFVMRDAVEIAAQVRVDDLGIAAIEPALDLPQRLVGAVVGSVGVLFWGQVLVKDRLHDQDRRHLHHAGADGGDAPSALPLLPNRLRDWSPSPIPIIRSTASRSRSSAFGVERFLSSSSDSPTGGMPPSPSATPIISPRLRMSCQLGPITSSISRASVKSSRCSIASLESVGPRLTTTPQRPRAILAKIIPIVPTPPGLVWRNVLMRLQRPSTPLVVAPSQVWDGLAAEDQAAAIQLLARLASNLVAQQSGSTQQEVPSCFHDLVPPRCSPSISTARP